MSGELSRRAALGAGAALAATAAIPARAAPADLRLVAGTYASEGGQGLYPIYYDAAGDRWTVGAPSGPANASFGVRSRRGIHYLLEETAKGRVGAFRPAAGQWTALGPPLPTEGADPCHAALNAAETSLAVANYSSGSVTLFALDRAGGLVGQPQLLQHEGHGPNADRQAGPHAHWVGFSPDGLWLHSVDLGNDRIVGAAFAGASGSLGAQFTAYQAPAGSGPRHLVHHPRLATAYLVSEMANTVTVLGSAGGARFTARAILPTLPAGFTGHSQAAHIAINDAGSRLYLSNRGHDSIAVFAINASGGLSLRQHVSTGGSWPRLFRLFEAQGRLLVANERAGEVAVFRIAGDGTLAPTGTRLPVPGVVFLDRV